MLLVLVVGVAGANVALIVAGLIPVYLGGVTLIAALVAIGLAILQARGGSR